MGLAFDGLGLDIACFGVEWDLARDIHSVAKYCNGRIRPNSSGQACREETLELSCFVAGEGKSGYFRE